MNTPRAAVGGTEVLRLISLIASRLRLRLPVSANDQVQILEYGVVPLIAAIVGGLYIAGSFAVWLKPDVWDGPAPDTAWLKMIAPLWFTSPLMPAVTGLLLIILMLVCKPTRSHFLRPRVAALISLAVVAISLVRIDIVATFGVQIAVLLGIIVCARLIYLRFVRASDEAGDGGDDA